MTPYRLTSTVRWLLSLAATVCFAVLPRTAIAQEVFFPNGTLLIGGMATDSQGDVWVSHLSYGSSLAMAEDVYVTEFSPTGYVKSRVWLARAQAQPGLTGGEQLGRLAFDPTTGQLWHLAVNGILTKIDPSTLRVLEFKSLGALGIDVRRVYDVEARQVRDFTGRISTSYSHWGDLSIHVWRDGQGRLVRDVFVSAIGRGGSLDLYGRLPYIARIRYVDGVQQSAQSILSTTLESGREARFDNLPRGIAVNRYGRAMTTLPVSQPSGFVFDAPVVFTIDFMERCVAQNFAACDRFLGVYDSMTASRGISTDWTGRFYIATGVKGSTWCPSMSGPIVLVSPDFHWVSCRSIGTGSALDSWDVAATFAGDAFYVILTDKGTVPFRNNALRFREPATAAISFDRVGLDFGSQPVGTESQSRSIQLTNVGAAALKISSVTTPAQFRQRSDCPVGSGSLAPGASCTIEITFAPSLVGAVSGMLTVNSNAYLSLSDIALAGRGVQ